MLPARSHLPTRPNTSSSASMRVTFGAKASTRSERSGPTGPGPANPSGTYRSRNTHTTASSPTPASIRNPA